MNNSFTVLPDKVDLSNVRVLSVGLVCDMPNTNMAKNRGKDKGKDKVKGKSNKCWDQDPYNSTPTCSNRQECLALYIGQHGHIACILAFGSDVRKFYNDSQDLAGSLMDISKLQSRAGQRGVRYCQHDTQLLKKLEPSDSGSYPVFGHDTSKINNDFATREHIQTTEVNSLVAIPLYVTSVTEAETSDQAQRFLTIQGTDMMGAEVGPVRLWRWTIEATGITEGRTYIFRGLKVAKETTRIWSDPEWKYKYVAADGAAQTVTHSWRTAAEDVSNVDSVMEYFL